MSAVILQSALACRMCAMGSKHTSMPNAHLHPSRACACADDSLPPPQVMSAVILQKADFSNAKFVGSQFARADAKGANLANADFTGALRCGVVGRRCCSRLQSTAASCSCRRLGADAGQLWLVSGGSARAAWETQASHGIIIVPSTPCGPLPNACADICPWPWPSLDAMPASCRPPNVHAPVPVPWCRQQRHKLLRDTGERVRGSRRGCSCALLVPPPAAGPVHHSALRPAPTCCPGRAALAAAAGHGRALLLDFLLTHQVLLAPALMAPDRALV